MLRNIARTWGMNWKHDKNPLRTWWDRSGNKGNWKPILSCSCEALGFSFHSFLHCSRRELKSQREIRVVIVVVVFFFFRDSLLILHSLLSCKFWRSIMQVMILESEVRLCFVE
jgi:hypothetical protein